MQMKKIYLVHFTQGIFNVWNQFKELLMHKFVFLF